MTSEQTILRCKAIYDTEWSLEISLSIVLFLGVCLPLENLPQT